MALNFHGPAFALLRAMDSTLTVDEMVDMVCEAKSNHSKRSTKVIKAYSDMLIKVNEAANQTYSNEWLLHMDNAVSSIVVIKHRLISHSAPDHVVECITTLIAVSILVKRAETSDKFRRESESIIGSARFPFVIPDDLKPFVTIFFCASNMFWVAFDQIRAVEGLTTELGDKIVTAMEELVGTFKLEVIWMSSLFGMTMESKQKTTILPDSVAITDVISPGGPADPNGKTVYLR
jgi:hypothetical protein